MSALTAADRDAKILALVEARAQDVQAAKLILERAIGLAAEAGLSSRQIAQAAGLSHTQVQNIARRAAA